MLRSFFSFYQHQMCLKVVSYSFIREVDITTHREFLLSNEHQKSKEAANRHACLVLSC
jgi:hypothetical protein